MIKRFFCRHDYVFDGSLMKFYQFGLGGKNNIFKCAKCGKEKLL